jgi:hypothetical protein
MVRRSRRWKEIDKKGGHGQWRRKEMVEIRLVMQTGLST